MDNLFLNPAIDESTTSAHWHTYSPFLNSFNKSDIIRIQIQNQNLNILPSTSLLYIEGTIKRADGSETTKTKLINNAIAFLFDEIRYELNGKEIDNNRNVGITSCLKNYISLNKNESQALINGSWSPEQPIQPQTLFFNYCIPLRRLLGFAEDYKNIVPNAKHEIILTRSRSDDNSFPCSDVNEKPKIQLTKVQWRVQHINLTDTLKLNLYRNITNNAKIMLAFRNWELYEYPSLPQNSNHHIWNVKTTTQLEKPRYIIFALQTDKLDQVTKDPSKFDHCNITDIKVYQNSECYPYEDMNLFFERNRYGIAYDEYTRFRSSYYNYPISEALLTLKEFKEKAMILIVDTRYQNENLKMGPVDVRIEMKSSTAIPDKTTAYCLMLHDRLVEFTPLTGEVNKIV
ncbi:uncharacterized protein LOC129616510 [Condylostylus longicornis]|uniref:uncharacterized protein LOC129614931 n=1 Tax=Condylostylus longicornis TaxID=2530218 RepID=UPI00244E1528|nr:uncharacterized protein LOC129614931 [Condylostylus longicornis]XP_055388139.1 uncharacterized protein LOC129616510 [Condylostylus longicornis]